MFDLGHLPPLESAISFEVFAKVGTHQIPIPKGCAFVILWVLAGGGGGGSGRAGAAASARGGGGGGGASNPALSIVPRLMLPDVIYLRMDPIASGGASGNNGAGGAVCQFTVPGLVILSGPGSSGGYAGAVTSGGAGGGIYSGSVNALEIGSVSYTNRAGAAGGAHTGAVGTSIQGLAQGICTPGAGGAGVGVSGIEYAGGDVLASALTPFVAGGTAGGGNGSLGLIVCRKPLISVGGSGGGSSDAGSGGDGGHALGYGCGGGGGGAGVTGGRGGNGGPPLAMMWVF